MFLFKTGCVFFLMEFALQNYVRSEAQLKLERMQQKAEQEQARLEAQKKAEKASAIQK